VIAAIACSQGLVPSDDSFALWARVVFQALIALITSISPFLDPSILPFLSSSSLVIWVAWLVI
jgi:hypothetical protein